MKEIKADLLCFMKGIILDIKAFNARLHLRGRNWADSILAARKWLSA
jgi:hypothetical protein